MLVYLDTSHLLKIEQGGAQSLPEVDRFLELWNAHDCTLALSPVHLCEFAQQQTAKDVERSLRALECFPRINLPGGEAALTEPVTLLADATIRVEALRQLNAFEWERFGLAARAERYDSIRKHWAPVSVAQLIARVVP